VAAVLVARRPALAVGVSLVGFLTAEEEADFDAKYMPTTTNARLQLKVRPAVTPRTAGTTTLMINQPVRMLTTQVMPEPFRGESPPEGSQERSS
jgi:hypothetical protein